MSLMSDFAIIMPTRNRPDIVQRSLEKTHSVLPAAPIYVFDDASEDAEAIQRAVAHVPGTTLLRSDVNVGPAGARCRLIEAAQARWLLAIDDDCYPREDLDLGRWIGMEPGLNDPIAICLRCYRSYDGDISPAGDIKIGPARGLHGGASLLHRRSILDIGNYNPIYVFGAEDTDLSRRIWASGRQVWVDPTQVIIHDHVPAGRNPPRESYFYVRNRILIGTLTLPIWYGLPFGLAQAARRMVMQPHKLSGFAGLFGGLAASVRHFGKRKPLSLKQFHALEALPS
jgi:GT2 family glycosyltransferase